MPSDESSANSGSDQPRLRAGDSDRDRVLQVIGRAHEAGRLTQTELLERQDQALQATYLDELPQLTADLPEQEGWPLLPSSTDRLPAQRNSGAELGEPERNQMLPATGPADAGFSVSIMSGRDVVIDPGTTDIGNFAWWGGNNYDLTRAMGPGRTVTLHLNAIMAGNDIYVPKGVRVVDESIAIMAGNTIKSKAQGDGSNGTLVLKGFLFWAGSTVSLSKRDKS